MRLWGYYALHTFINSIKKMFRSKVIVVIFCTILLFGVLGFFGGLFAEKIFDDSEDKTEISQVMAEEVEDGHSYIFSNEEIDKIFTKREIYYNSTRETYSDVEGEALYLYDLADFDDKAVKKLLSSPMDEEDKSKIELKDVTWSADELSLDKVEEYHMSKEDVNMIKMILRVAAVAGFLLILVMSVNFAAKTGKEIFLMSDVNILFTAPMKPQSVLLFRLSFQIVSGLVGMFYLLFQIPNLLNAGFSLLMIMIAFLGVILLMITNRVISVCMYTICSSNSWLKKNIAMIGKILALLIVAVNVLVYVQMNKDLMATVETLYCNDYIKFIPFIGWFERMVVFGINGNLQMSLVFLGLYIIGLVAIIWLTWRIPADFYEEALEGAAEREAAVAAAETNMVERKKERSSKIKRNTGMKGYGASVFFHKEMYNRKRMARFGFLTKTMSTYLLVSFAFIAIYLKTSFREFNLLAFVYAGFIFFRSFANPLGQESSNHWIALVPESAYSKVFYSTMAGTVACLLDLLPGYILGAVILKANILLALLWLANLIVLDFMVSSTGAMFEALLPAEGLDNIKASFQLMLRMILVIVLIAALTLGFIFVNMYVGLILSTLIAIVFSVLAFIVYPMKLQAGI